MINYKSKYLKYKLKYKSLIQKGGVDTQPELLIDVNRTGPKSNETINCFNLRESRCKQNKEKCVWKTSHHPPNYPLNSSQNSQKLHSMSYCKPHDHDFISKKQNYRRFNNSLSYYIDKKNDNEIKQKTLVDEINGKPTEIQMKKYSKLLVENHECLEKIEDYEKKIDEIIQEYNEYYLQD